MRAYFLPICLFLMGCTATVSDQFQPTIGSAVPQPVAQQFSQSGTVFFGKFATSSALNSGRSFVSDFHGEVRITVFPNEKVECRFWAEGRITDETLYEGWDGFVEAYATLCTGRLQKDGSFSFQGAYIPSGATINSEEDIAETFTLKGAITGEAMLGELQIGSVFRNAVVIADADEIQDLGEGVVFEAVPLE